MARGQLLPFSSGLKDDRFVKAQLAVPGLDDQVAVSSDLYRKFYAAIFVGRVA